jgi:hypothetical protein
MKNNILVKLGYASNVSHVSTSTCNTSNTNHGGTRVSNAIPRSSTTHSKADGQVKFKLSLILMIFKIKEKFISLKYICICISFVISFHLNLTISFYLVVLKTTTQKAMIFGSFTSLKDTFLIALFLSFYGGKVIKKPTFYFFQFSYIFCLKSNIFIGFF